MNYTADDIVDDPIDVNLEAPIDDLRREASSLEEEIEAIEAMIRDLKDKCEDYRRIIDEVQTEIVERELEAELAELNAA
jgi:peptidoglycan hydrolase CwlO-like protein